MGIQVGHRGGFRILDGDFDGALGGVEELGGALPLGNDRPDSSDILVSLQNQCAGHRQAQQFLFVESRMVGAILRPFENRLRQFQAQENHQRLDREAAGLLFWPKHDELRRRNHRYFAAWLNDRYFLQIGAKP